MNAPINAEQETGKSAIRETGIDAVRQIGFEGQQLRTQLENSLLQSMIQKVAAAELDDLDRITKLLCEIRKQDAAGDKNLVTLIAALEKTADRPAPRATTSTASTPTGSPRSTETSSRRAASPPTVRAVSDASAPPIDSAALRQSVRQSAREIYGIYSREDRAAPESNDAPSTPAANNNHPVPANRNPATPPNQPHPKTPHHPSPIHQIHGLSAHADRTGLLDWLGHFKKPERIFLTHGDEDAAEALAKEIRSRWGYDVTVPAYQDAVELG